MTIVDLHADAACASRWRTHEVTIELTDEAKELLVDKGYDPAMGARPLRRAIQRYIEDPLADFVLGRAARARLDDPRRAQGGRGRRAGRGRHHLHPRRGHAGAGHRPAGGARAPPTRASSAPELAQPQTALGGAEPGRLRVPRGRRIPACRTCPTSDLRPSHCPRAAAATSRGRAQLPGAAPALPRNGEVAR